jgi:hypothetical protein
MSMLQLRLALAVNAKALKDAMRDGKARDVEMLIVQRSVLKDMIIELLMRKAA